MKIQNHSHSFFTKRSLQRLAPLFLGVALFFGSSFSSWASMVDDQAGLFSTSAKQQAEKIMAQIHDNTTPVKEVEVVTVASLPVGVDAEVEAENQFRKRNISGILIFIVKNPHRLFAVVGKNTQERFREKIALQEQIASRFKQNDYDGGLLTGLRFAQNRLTLAFPRNYRAVTPMSVPYHPTEMNFSPRRHFSFTWIVWVGLGIVGVVLLVRLLTRNSGPSVGGGSVVGSSYGNGTMYGGGYGSPSFTGGGSSGDWVKPVVGGVAGAVAGNWLYDKFIRGDEHSHSSYSHDSSYSSSSSSDVSNDDGQVGSSYGGSGSSDDWGSSSSSDSWGSSDSGGDSSGGSDW